MQPKQGDQAVLAVIEKNILISSGHVLNGLCSGNSSGPCVGEMLCSLWSELYLNGRQENEAQADAFV